jgi:hypothetical protein
MRVPALVLAMALTPVFGAKLRIRHVPRVVDAQFATRLTLCPGAPASGGMSRANDARRSVAQLLGPELIELQVHQIGDSFPDFGKVVSHIRGLLNRRPQHLSRSIHWAEPTPLAAYGILGTLRYTHGRKGWIEIAGLHVCAQDSAGRFWWIRLAPVDLWP